MGVDLSDLFGTNLGREFGHDLGQSGGSIGLFWNKIARVWLVQCISYCFSIPNVFWFFSSYFLVSLSISYRTYQDHEICK